MCHPPSTQPSCVTPAGLHARGASGGDHDHRDSDRAVAAGGAGRPRGGTRWRSARTTSNNSPWASSTTKAPRSGFPPAAGDSPGPATPTWEPTGASRAAGPTTSCPISSSNRCTTWARGCRPAQKYAAHIQRMSTPLTVFYCPTRRPAIAYPWQATVGGRPPRGQPGDADGGVPQRLRRQRRRSIHRHARIRRRPRLEPEYVQLCRRAGRPRQFAGVRRHGRYYVLGTGHLRRCRRDCHGRVVFRQHAQNVATSPTGSATRTCSARSTSTRTGMPRATTPATTSRRWWATMRTLRVTRT